MFHGLTTRDDDGTSLDLTKDWDSTAFCSNTKYATAKEKLQAKSQKLTHKVGQQSVWKSQNLQTILTTSLSDPIKSIQRVPHLSEYI